MSRRVTQVYWINNKQMLDWKSTQMEVSGTWLPARDTRISLPFIERVKHAWRVLTNQADVLYWQHLD